MPIKRVNYQENITLTEFYERESQEGGELHRQKAQAMIPVIILLNDLFKETILLGETSHLSIGLIPEHAEDTHAAKVRIENFGLEDMYLVSFSLPAEIQPWEHAWVEGKQVHTTELKKYILIAMNASKAWGDNPEVVRLIAENIHN